MIIGYHEISMKHHRSTKIWNGSLCITKSWPSCAEPIRRSTFRISRRRALPRSSSSSSTKTSAQKKLGIILPYLPLDSDIFRWKTHWIHWIPRHQKTKREENPSIWAGNSGLSMDPRNELLQSRNSTPEIDLIQSVLWLVHEESRIFWAQESWSSQHLSNL